MLEKYFNGNGKIYALNAPWQHALYNTAQINYQTPHSWLNKQTKRCRVNSIPKKVHDIKQSQT